MWIYKFELELNDISFSHCSVIETQVCLSFEFRRIQALQTILDGGKKLPFPDGILINGRGPNGVTFTVEQGKKNDEYWH